MQRPTKPTVVLLGIAVTALVVMAIVDFLRPMPPRQRLELLREELAPLRAASDSCRTALEQEEAALSASDARFDSLRDRIADLEDLDPRGVPADSYDIYLRAFRSYNRGIPERAAAGDTLAAHWQACRELVARHNRLADSALTLARELGVLRRSKRNGQQQAQPDSLSE